MLTRISYHSGRRRRRACSGWSLVELAVAVTAGLIILAAFVTTSLSIRVTMMQVGNYADLDKGSRQTLDNLSRDIRNALSVSTASTTSLLMLTNKYSGTNLIITYAWDGSNNVTRSVNGTITGTMLTSCDSLIFSYFIRIPTNNLQFVSITNVMSTNQVKLINVSWRCSRSVMGSRLNTESVQTAAIAMRN